MNHIYKTIWNKTKNAFDVVAENVSSKGKKTSGSKSGAETGFGQVSHFLAVLTPLAAMLFVQSSLAEVIVGDTNTQVHNANNGVQIIDIATANAAGISHNRYVSYNVDKTGQVLNNAAQSASQLSVMTELAGKIMTNANLNTSAKVILNEVTGANRSALNGHIEVAGAKADVILANPYGITCSGCGFINTDRATLTTGTPKFSADGNITGFNIIQGNISIAGNGLNANSAGLLRLLSRNLSIDGQVNAQQLEAVTGANAYDYTTGKASAIAGTGAAAQYAIDSTLLGGLYANRISLISTEQGVGVRMAGDAAASAADFTLSAAGDIQLNNKINAKQTINIQNASSQQQKLNIQGGLTANNISIGAANTQKLNVDVAGGTLYAGSALDIQSQAFNANNAKIQAKDTLKVNANSDIALQNTVLDAADLQVKSNAFTAQDSQLKSAQNITIQTAQDLKLKNTDAEVQNNVVLSSASGNMELAGGKLKAGNALDLKANHLALSAQTSATNANIQAQQFTLDENGLIVSLNNTALNASNADVWGQMYSSAANFNIGGTLNSANKTLVSVLNLNTVNAKDLNLKGLWEAGNLTLTAVNSLQQAGAIYAQNNLALQANAMSLTGAVQAGHKLNANAVQQLTVDSQAQLFSSDSIELSADAIQLDGYAGAENSMTAIAANNLTAGTAAQLESNGLIALQSKNADIDLQGKTYAQNQTISAQKNLNIAAGASVTTVGDLNITVDTLNNTGAVNTQQLTKAQLKKLNNQGSLISDKFELGTLDSLNNSGKLISNQDLELNTAALTNTQNSILAGNSNLNLHINGADFNNQGVISAMGSLVLDAAQINTVNNGSLSAGNQLNINTQMLDNAGKLNASAVNISASDVNNSANIIGSTVKINADKKADSAIVNSGEIYAANQANLTASDKIDNTGYIYTVNNQNTGAVNLTAQQLLNGSKGIISTNNLLLKTDKIVNAGQISADAAGIEGKTSLQTALTNTGKSSSNTGIYIYDSLNAKNLSTLNNSGDVYVNLKASDNRSEISAADLTNSSGAYLYLGNNTSFNQTGLVSKNAGEIYVQSNGVAPLATSVSFAKLDNSGGTLSIDAATLNFSNNYQHTGTLNAMNSSAVNANADFINSSTGKVNLYNSDLKAKSLTNQNEIKTSGISKIAAETKLVNNKLIHSAGTLFIDAAALTNAAKSGIISLDNLLINTQRSDANTITNFGDVYAAAYLVLGNKISKKTNVSNKMNSNQSQVSGGNLQAGKGIEVYGHDFENNYNVLVNEGDINLELSGKFVNERTYYGNKINITETWNTPQMYLTSDNDWGDESFYDSASNTVIYTTQVAIKGGGDDGVQASVVTETWKKSTDVKAGTETNYDTIKNYLNGDIGQAKIGANNGNITINYVDDSKNIGAKIYAAGAGNGTGTVNIQGPGNFTNQSIDLYRDKLFELKYLLLTDHSNRAGAVVGLDSTKNVDYQLDDIDSDGKYNRSNNYIDAIKGLSGIFYSYRDTNMDKYTTVKDRSGDNYTVTYNVKNVIDAIRSKVKSDGFKALVDNKGQSNTAQSKASVTGNTVFIKAKNLTNESESNLNHLALNNDKKLCANLGLTCQIDKAATDKKENADAPQDEADAEAPKKQVDTTKYTDDVRIQAVNPVSQAPAVNLSLPVSDYGQYITSKNPNSKYLVESNPLYGENSNVIGSDYLQEKLGINPDKLMKRLGDNGYEMNLVQQQLISSLGTAVLYANSSMADQMQKLFDQASDQSSGLGLKYGKALTSDQISNLKQDIVWMVATEVAGQKVLVPQVYLSKATVDSISTSGAVIEGKNLTYLDVESLDNKNAAIRGGTVVVDAKKDINNIGAQIKGGNVFLTSKEGSINNITEVHTSGTDSDRKTSIGAVAGIVSEGALVMDAAKDINNVSAKLKAGETLALKAGNNINILSIQDAEASSKSIKNGRSSTSSVTHMGSVLEAGGNVIMDSGKDTTIKGSDVTAGGLMYVKTGGDFKLLADQDTTETKTSTARSGLGVGGGIWGKETVETTDFKGTNKASNLSVGSLIVDSEGKAIIEGSNIGIRDKASTSLIRGKAGVDILDGKDEERHEKTTTTSTYLKSTKGSASNDNPIYGAAADDIQKDKKGKFDGNATQNMYGASTEDEPDVKANASAKAEKTKLSMTAQAGASASAKGEAALKISETTKTVEKSGSSTSVASNIVSAGNLAIMSDNTVNVRGSNVDVDGKLAIAAKNLLVEAGKNTSYASRDVKRTSVGIFAEGDASAQAGAQAGGKVGVNGASLGVNAGASAEANGTVTFGAKTEHQNETMNSLTHSNSSLKSGSDMLIKVTDTATFQGADVQAGQWDKDGKPVGAPAALRIEAKNIKNLAVQDTHSETSTSSSKLAGVYLSGSVSAQASAQAGASADATNINPLSAGASASAGVSAEVGAGLRTAIENNEQSYDTVTNKGNNFKATGSFVRIAENEILDQATQVNAGSIYQSAATIKDEAVHDSQTFHSNSQSHEARLGVYAEAGASANVSAQASLGATASTGTGTQSSGARESASNGTKSTKVAVGVSAQYSMESSKVDSKDTQARSSSFTSSGNITSISSGETQLNGTQFNSTGGGINLEASKLTYNAVHDTHESSSTSRKVDVNAKVGVDLKGVPDIELGAEYGQNKSNAKSSTAVVGGLKAAGNITVRANEANFEGTALTGNHVSVQANSTAFTAAESTSTSNSTGFGVGVGFENAQKSTKARENVQRTVIKADGTTASDTTHKSGGVSASFDIAKNNSTKYTGSEITANRFEVSAPAANTAATLNADAAGPVNFAPASQLVSRPELARNADGKAIIHDGAPVIIAKQTEVKIPAIESSNDKALLGAPVAAQPASSGDTASSQPTLSMENVKFKSVNSKGKAVEDNSINKTDTSAVQVTSTTKKDSKSGFELGGEGSADSSDLRQIQNNRNAYKGTRVPGQVRQATETLTQNDTRGTENTNQNSTHRNVYDAIGNTVGQLRDKLRTNTAP